MKKHKPLSLTLKNGHTEYFDNGYQMYVYCAKHQPHLVKQANTVEDTLEREDKINSIKQAISNTELKGGVC